MRIAVLGMGRMGHAVASRLLGEGHDVVAWNRSPGKADDLVERGAEEASTPAAAARAADVVVTLLTDDSAVLAVVTGDEGVAASLEGQPDAVYVDMSTISPEGARRLTEATGGRHVASPVLGAPQAVESGAAAYLAAGPKECYDRLGPMYGSLTERVTYLGPDPARALQLKLLANYLLMSGIAVLSEVVATAEAIGLPTDQLRSFLESSPLVAPGLRNRLDGLLATDHEGWFTTTLGAKDVGLAEQMGGREGLRLPIADLVKRRYEEAAAEGHGGEDLTAVVELVRGQLAR